jgi:hypothetical protein
MLCSLNITYSSCHRVQLARDSSSSSIPQSSYRQEWVSIKFFLFA